MINHLTDAQMNQYFGWVHVSDTPSTYVHMSYGVDGTFLETSRLKTKWKGRKRYHFTKKSALAAKNKTLQLASSASDMVPFLTWK